MTTNSTFVRVNEEFAIIGACSASDLESLRGDYKSVLYLCPDTASDSGLEGGFATAQAVFGAENAATSPVVIDVDAFSGSVASTVGAYREYQAQKAALDVLPRPTLIACKTNRRAGAVYALYNGIKNGWTKEQIDADSTTRGFGYLGNARLAGWVSSVHATAGAGKAPLLFRQLFEAESSTYTYLLADSVSGDAILIDPVLETVERDAKLITELNLTLRYGVNTHCHADHITGTGLLKERFPTCRSAIALLSTADADIKLNEFDVIRFGSRYVYCLSTPGHTSGCFTYVLDDLSMAFTGDTVLIRGCGRTDFQGGSSEQLYESVHSKIFTLPETTILYPAHDYKGFTASSVCEEKRLNPRLTKPLPEFVAIMAGLNLPYPKKIDASLPRNLKCGYQ